MMYLIIDTETCDCCSNLEHKRLLGKSNSLQAAADYLIEHYDNDQLFEDCFDKVVIRNTKSNECWTASECLQKMRYIPKIVAAKAAVRLKMAKEWLKVA